MGTSSDSGVFVAGLTADGGIGWQASYSGAGFDTARGVAVRAPGPLWITGSYGEPSISFEKQLLNGGVKDIFLLQHQP